MKEVDPAIYLFLLILVVGALLTAASVFSILRGVQTLRWKITHAHIEESEYSGTDKQNRAQMSIRLLLGFFGSAPSHQAKINYRYFVSEKEYFSSRFQIGMMSTSNRDRIESILNQYTVGEVVEIYYDPVCPHRSVIRKGPAIDSIKMFCLGIVMTFIGGYVSSAFLSL